MTAAMYGGPQVPPQNAPPNADLTVGVQPGTPGIVFAEIVVIYGTKGAILIYSPTPGAGNLIGSWAGEAGTDQYGNPYPAGLAVGNSSGPQVELLPSVGITLEMTMPATGNPPHNVTSFAELEQVVLLPSNSGSETAPPLMGTSVITYTNGEVSDALFITSGIINTGLGGFGHFELYVGMSSGGTYPAGKIAGLYNVLSVGVYSLDPGQAETLSGGYDSTGYYSQNGGAGMFQTQFTPQTSGSDTGGQNLLPAMEGWCYVGSGGTMPAFATGWTNRGSPWATLAFKRVASPINFVWIRGWVTKSSGTATTLFTLPAEYTPNTSQTFVSINGTASSITQWNIASTGVVGLSFPAAAVAGDNYWIDFGLSLDI
jgi:hypothetical protein